MTLPHLDAAAVSAATPYPALIDALADAFRDARVTAPARHGHALPGGNTLLLMPAWSEGGPYGVKLVSVFPGNGTRSLPAIQGVYLLFDGATGQPIASLDGAELTARRTAAASALAARHLAPRDASRLLLVATGRLGPELAQAHADVRPIRQIRVAGRDPARVAALVQRLGKLGFEAEAAPSLPEAIGWADLISCATLATAPWITGRHLRPGQHLDLVGAFRPDMVEADPDAVDRADLVAVDTREGAMHEAGDLLQAIAAGRFEAGRIACDLAGLVGGAHPGRTQDDQVTLFKSVGAAIEDLAAARLATGC